MPTKKDLLTKVNENIAERIKEARLCKGLQKVQLAKMMNISYQQICKYETGENTISPAKLYHISKLCETPISWFFEKCEYDLKETIPSKGQVACIDHVRDFMKLSKTQQKVLKTLTKAMVANDR